MLAYLSKLWERMFGTCAKGGYHQWVSEPITVRSRYNLREQVRCAKCGGVQVSCEHSGGICGDGDNYFCWVWSSDV